MANGTPHTSAALSSFSARLHPPPQGIVRFFSCLSRNGISPLIAIGAGRQHAQKQHRAARLPVFRGVKRPRSSPRSHHIRTWDRGEKKRWAKTSYRIEEAPAWSNKNRACGWAHSIRRAYMYSRPRPAPKQYTTTACLPLANSRQVGKEGASLPRDG